MIKVTKDTMIGGILDLDQSTALFFLEMGMRYLDCSAFREESIREACMVHGVNLDAPVEKLNVHLGAK